MQNQDTPKPPAAADQTTDRVGVGRCDLLADDLLSSLPVTVHVHPGGEIWSNGIRYPKVSLAALRKVANQRDLKIRNYRCDATLSDAYVFSSANKNYPHKSVAENENPTP
jgi:hypothetical protein